MSLKASILAFSIVLVMVAGCRSSAQADDLKSTVEERVSNEREGDVSAVHGMTESDVVGSLGQPDDSRDFTMAECCHEFEIELYNTYPPVDGTHDDVEIHERHWKFDDHILTVWFHEVEGEWTALDAHLWHKDTEF